ncbi:MAG: endopeptidase La [Bacilli bacterium]|nr:endopeptidase La [Bacilli bacterium]
MVETNLPVLLLKNVLLFPYSEIRVEFIKSREKLILDNAVKNNDNHVLLVNLLDPLEEKPNISDLPDIGVIGRIKSKIELSNGVVRVVIVGLSRVEVLNYLENEEGYREAFVIPVRDYEDNPAMNEALRRVLFKNLNSYINISSMMSNSVLGRISDVDNIDKLTDIIISELPISYANKLKYLYESNPLQRIKLLVEELQREIETVELENEIETNLKEKIDSSQREFLLREKIRIIKEELGESTIKEDETQELKRRIDKKNLPEAVKLRLNDELNRYSFSSQASAEVSIIRTYMEWLLSLPWLEETHDNYKVKEVMERLDETHYGLDDVKNRIVSFVAVMKHTNNASSPILCLIGPPGVGKTTLAKSVANSLGRKFVKISVGGISDEAEIIGHRRTYLGANPGKIIQGMKKVGVNNPVFLIDEIDKLTKDYRGDPAAALLDVLDKEQNRNFCDNYIEEEFDLSNVLFILTANDISKIPNALRDRLEVIELSSYTNYDKLEIAKKYLIPKLFKEYKIRDYNISINDYAINKIITDYTKEAGARELSRKIEEICRKVIVDDINDVIIKVSNLKDFLGNGKYYHQKNDVSKDSGIVNALAYTVYGGEILKISVAMYKGSGNFKITGSVGDVMRESVDVAFSYIKSKANSFEIDEELFKNNDFHFHIEEGATPKDGPSAGISITTAIISLLKDFVIDHNVSMTGEMTLRGKILPVGGLKEKLIAATVNDIKRVFIPVENSVDLDEIPELVKQKLEIILVRDYLEIYHYLFNKDKK